MRMKIHERVAQLEKRVARLEGQAQAQPYDQTAQEIIQDQINMLTDVQQKLIMRGHYDSILEISTEIVKMATLAQQPVRQ